MKLHLQKTCRAGMVSQASCTIWLHSGRLQPDLPGLSFDHLVQPQRWRPKGLRLEKPGIWRGSMYNTRFHKATGPLYRWFGSQNLKKGKTYGERYLGLLTSQKEEFLNSIGVRSKHTFISRMKFLHSYTWNFGSAWINFGFVTPISLMFVGYCVPWFRPSPYIAFWTRHEYMLFEGHCKNK